MKRNLTLKILIMLGIIAIVAGCSDYTKDEKKAYQSILQYQKNNFPKSNRELEIVYPKLKEIEPASIIEGTSEYGNNFWNFEGVYTYNPEKVLGEEHLDRDGTNRFDTQVELIDGEYVVKYYFENLKIRTGMDK